MISKPERRRAEKAAKSVIERARDGDPAIKDEMISASIVCPVCKKGTMHVSSHDGKTNMRCSIKGCIGWGNGKAESETKTK